MYIYIYIVMIFQPWVTLDQQISVDQFAGHPLKSTENISKHNYPEVRRERFRARVASHIPYIFPNGEPFGARVFQPSNG